MIDLVGKRFILKNLHQIKSTICSTFCLFLGDTHEIQGHWVLKCEYFIALSFSLFCFLDGFVLVFSTSWPAGWGASDRQPADIFSNYASLTKVHPPPSCRDYIIAKHSTIYFLYRELNQVNSRILYP